MRQSTRHSLLSLAMLAVTMLGIPAAVGAQTFTWNGSCSTSWHDGCNWDLNAVPPDGNPGVVVTIPSFQIPFQSQIGQPTTFAGTLDIWGTLINASQLSNSGQMHFQYGGILDNQGTFVNGSGGRLDFNGVPAGLQNSGTFDNFGVIYTNPVISNGVQNTGTFNNYGLLTSYGGIFNSGTLNNYGYASSNDGGFRNSGIVNNFGTLELGSDGSFSTSGTLINSGYIFNNSPGFDIESTGHMINTGLIENVYEMAVAGLLENSGQIVELYSNTRVSVAPTGTLINTGTLSAFDVSVWGALRNDGIITMNEGNLQMGTGTLPLTINPGGILTGTGVINGNVDMQGVLGPGNSTGILTINGGYFQGSTGQLQIEIGGTTPGTGYDQLQVNGSAFLDGLLLLTFVNQFAPQDGDTILFLVYSGFSGAFSAVTVSNLSGLFTWTINYGANGASVTFHQVVPEPSTLLLFGTGLAAALFQRRRARQPRPANSEA